MEAAPNFGRDEPVDGLYRLGLSKRPLEGSLTDEHDRFLNGVFQADIELEIDVLMGVPFKCTLITYIEDRLFLRSLSL